MRDLLQNKIMINYVIYVHMEIENNQDMNVQ